MASQPPEDRRPPSSHTDPDMPRPGDDGLGDTELFSGLAGFDSQGTDLMPLPDGALDDLPPPSSASSSWLGRENLAGDESDVIRGLTAQPPPPGSSNIFDTGPGGSARFSDRRDGTDHLTGEQPRPSNDVLLGDPDPSSISGFRDGLYDPPLTPPPVSAVHRRPDSRGGPDFDATDTGDEGSNLFADPTGADLTLGDPDDAVPLGEPTTDSHHHPSGPGSSIFAGGDLGAALGSHLDVDKIPMMASADEGRADDLPLEVELAPARRPPTPRPDGDGAIGFDLPAGGDDPEHTERSGIHNWDLPVTAGGSTGQKSRYMALDGDVQAGPSSQTGLDAVAAGLVGPASAITRQRPAPPPEDRRDTMRKPVAQVTGRAPVPFDLEPPARSRTGWLAGGGLGLLAGAGAATAAAYLGGFLATETPAPRPAPPVAAAPAPDATVADLAGKLQQAEEKAEAVRKQADADVAAVRRQVAALRAELDKARVPSPELGDLRGKLAEAQTLAGQAQTAAATAEVKLGAANKELADKAAELKQAGERLAAAEARVAKADAALAGVVDALKANDLADPAADPEAVLAKLPDTLKAAAAAAVSADARKAAEAVTTARNEAEASRAELTRVRKSVEAGVADARRLQGELDAAKKAADEAVARERAAAAAREQAIKQDADRKLAQQAEDHRRQLSDARSGVAVPLTNVEARARQVAEFGYGKGVTAYFAGDAAAARDALEGAAARYDGDARIWYFLGLARWQTGDGVGAGTAFQKGADLERKSRTARRLVDEALTRVQGWERAALKPYRP